MYKWLLTIGLSVATVVAVSFFYQHRLNFKQEGNRIEALTSRIDGLEKNKRALENQQQNAQQWAALSQRLRGSNFDPDRWEIYPVAINSNLPWAEFEELMLSISNANNKASGYWFNPESLQAKTSSNLPGNLLQQFTTTQDAAAVPSVQVNLKGAFLIHQ